MFIRRPPKGGFLIPAIAKSYARDCAQEEVSTNKIDSASGYAAETCIKMRNVDLISKRTLSGAIEKSV